MFKFTRYATAQDFVNHCDAIMQIVHGDNGYLWVITPREASKLEKLGYEVVR